MLPSVDIDAVATINTANDSSYTVTGTCTIGDGNVSYTFSSPSGGTDVTGSVACSGGGTWTTGAISLASLNDDAAITFDANQTDSASNTTNAAQRSALKDTNRPTISSITTTASGTYNNGQSFSYTVNFSESVTIAAGTRVSMNVGGSTYYATCSATTATSTSCTYTAGAEIDHDGVVTNAPFDLNGSSITDANGNTLTNTSFSAPDTSAALINSSGLPVFEWEESSATVTTYDYGDPNTNVTVTFTVKNIGNASTTPGWFTVSVTNDGGGVYSITTDNCSGVVVAPASSCTVNIQYTDAVGATGLKSGQVSASDTGATTVNLSLTGTY